MKANITVLGGDGIGPEVTREAVLALEKVGEAREAAAGNVNPQVLLAVLGEDLAEVL